MMYNRGIKKSNSFQEGTVDQNNIMKNMRLASEQRDNF
jgi:hypothetical protein